MTAIEWTDETWNPTTGCDRISPGCDHCYALTMAKRLKGMGSAKYQNDGDPATSGPGFALTEHADTLAAPLGWRKPRKVFVNSMSDLFHKDVTDEFIARVFAVMAVTPQHTYQVLTKRPQRMARWMNADFLGETAQHRVQDAILDLTRSVWKWKRPVIFDPRMASETNRSTTQGDLADDPHYERRVPLTWPLPNAHLGVSIESDKYAWRADYLRETPAAVRFVSAEPLLGPLPSLDLTGIDWLIVGGESGPGARPMHPDWVRDLRDRCTAPVLDGEEFWPLGKTSFFFKQWGAWRCWTDNAGHQADDVPMDADALDDRTVARWDMDRHGNNLTGSDESPTSDAPSIFLHVGKHAAGRTLDGRTWDEYPPSSTPVPCPAVADDGTRTVMQGVFTLPTAVAETVEEGAVA